MMTRMKKMTVELIYPDATVEQVHTMLGDQAFQEEVCDRQHVLRKTVTIERDGEAMVVRKEQVQQTQGIPSFATKFVGSETTITSVDAWASPTAGTLNVSLPGPLGALTGTLAKQQRGNDVVQTVTLDIKVGIPLVGGKLEGVVADLMGKAMAKENQVGREWLTR
jgi:hypothetical protein